MFVLSAPAERPLRDQARAVFQSVAAEMSALGGALLDEVTASEARGFELLMERRSGGELAWERVCPFDDENNYSRPVLKMKKPYTMLAFGGYPCWFLEGHTYSIDLFNPGNELMLASDDSGKRLWAIWFWPPNIPFPSRTFERVLGSAASALNAQFGFGGSWLPQAIFSYRFADFSDDKYLKPLPPELRLEDMSYPYMVLRKQDLSSSVFDHLRAMDMKVQRPGHEAFAAFQDLGRNNEYVFFRLGWLYPQGDDSLVEQVAELIGKPYVKTMVLRDTTSKWL